MFITLKKRTVIFSALVIVCSLFLIANIANFITTKDNIETYSEVSEEKEDIEEEFKETSSPISLETEIDSSTREQDYFVDYKLQRDRVRSRQIEILREIVNNPNSNSENRIIAQEKLFQISDNLEHEMELENLLAAKGYMKTAVLIQPENVTVVVGTDELSGQDVAKISDLAVTTTGYTIEDIVIFNAEQIN